MFNTLEWSKSQMLLSIVKVHRPQKIEHVNSDIDWKDSGILLVILPLKSCATGRTMSHFCFESSDWLI